MRTRSNGPAATLLLFVGLAVVAFVGVFGIPQFAPVVASPAEDPDQGGHGAFGLRPEIRVGGVAGRERSVAPSGISRGHED